MMWLTRFIQEICSEEIKKLMESAKAYGKSPYGVHLKAVAEGRVKY